jgi:hypothetical protein
MSTGSRSQEAEQQTARDRWVAGQRSGGETRTRNPLINSQMLCRLSYPGMAASHSNARTRPMTLR